MKKAEQKENKKSVNKVKVVVALIITLMPTFIFLGLLANYGPSLGIYLLPQSPQKYVEQAVILMNTQGLYSSTDEWAEMRSKTISAAKGISTFEEAHELVDQALKVAGGKHSRLVSKEEVVGDGGVTPSEVYVTEDNVLMIKLPEFSANNVEGQHYADVVVSGIEKNWSQVDGIIIDLRDNRGGNMGPMVAAVAPLLTDGEIMKFNIQGFDRAVTLSNGTVSGGGSTVSVKPFKISTYPIAILQNEKTASSGEATLLAFRGMENVKTFGTDTAGYCSCNTTRKMYDKAQLQLTIGTIVARTGEEFCEDPINPDVYSENPIEDAVEWIRSCRVN